MATVLIGITTVLFVITTVLMGHEDGREGGLYRPQEN